VSSQSPAIIQEESQDELEDGEAEASGLHEVGHRREIGMVAEHPAQDTEHATEALESESSRIDGNQASLLAGDVIRRTLETSDEQARISSTSSLSSSYQDDNGMQDIWAHVLGTGQTSSEEEPEAIKTPSSAVLSDTLRKLSGLGQDDLASLQDRLVDKAKAERQAYRDDSPIINVSPVFLYFA
jgi:hypothetical protein